ncbi:MAG: S-adenosylmethionine:tRNA ribosyltransferase-isomerase [Schleiferiaceae bacterium]|nr:S-adenosylmethionine:tRNA ribosyltransferase-isomerase [Schleiferiaceae bacterium]
MDPRQLRISDYGYELPDQRIAQFALEPRDAAKLLTWNAGTIAHRHVSDMMQAIADLGFGQGGHLVLNETRVVQARLIFPRGDAKPFELFYLHPAKDSVEQAMAAQGRLEAICKVRYSKKWKDGDILMIDRLRARRIRIEGDVSVVEFFWDSQETWSELLEHLGQLPLPPYLQRQAEAADHERYQTVFARVEGSVAAPTAGLHWTEALLKEIEAKAWTPAKVRLHVGAGTFQPVSSERMEDHPMHSEEISIDVSTMRSLADDQTIWAVGTTAARTLESLYWLGLSVLDGNDPPHCLDQWAPYASREVWPSRGEALHGLADALEAAGRDRYLGQSALLIAPPYSMKVVDVLMTNFHQPHSTLLLLVAAAIGPKWFELYQSALNSDYRFLSYGDACLLRVQP